MLLYRNSKGIIHLIPLLLGLAVILGLGAVYYSAQPRTSSQQSFNLYRELMGEDGQVAGYDAVIPPLK